MVKCFVVSLSNLLFERQVQLETLSLAPCCVAGRHWAIAHCREAKIVALTVCGQDFQQVMQLSNVLEATVLASLAAAMQQVRHFALHLEMGSS